MGRLKPISVTWYGHSAFLLRDTGGFTVLIDPWLDNPKSPVRPGGINRPDLILITHGHQDHIGNAVEIAGRTGAPVVAIHELSLWLESRGVRNVTGMNKGGSTTAGPVTVTMTNAVHSSDIDVGGGKDMRPGGTPAGFVIAFPDHPTVYHAGDTDVFGDMRIIRELHKPDIAILPIGGLYTMGPREAALAVSFLEPRHVIGMHYGTFPPLRGTPRELAGHLPADRKGIVAELVPGTARTFE
jgi:L-ascorbate metabolism protein UlaG (beta-lactamase superfamily)